LLLFTKHKNLEPSLILIVLFILISSIIILALVPPVSRDALIHHLAVPKIFLQHGSLCELPYLPFSYYPMNLDFLYMIPLYFGNDIIPKFIHFGFALLTAWLIYGYLKRRTSLTYALFGVVFFLSIPVIIKLSITVYVDLGVIFFSTAALLLLLRWIENGFLKRDLIYAACMCGLAMGVKYNGLITFFLLSCLIPFYSSRYRQTGRLGTLKILTSWFIFSLLALIMFSPWMIRNYYWKNNPIYPLYNKWFNHSRPIIIRSVNPQVIKKGKIGIFGYRNKAYNETWPQIALLPLRIFFQGRDGDPQYFDGKLNPFLLLLPILAFYRLRDGPPAIQREKKILLIFSVLFFAFAFFSAALRIRYIAPVIPPLVILAAYGLQNIRTILQRITLLKIEKTGPFLLILFVLLSLGLNFRYLISQFNSVDPLPYLTGSIGRDDYITRYRPEYSAFKYINKNVSEKSVILFVFIGKRGYYCDREYIPDTGGQVKWLYGLVKKSRTPEDLLDHFARRSITHLLISMPIFHEWVNDVFDMEKLELLDRFFKQYLDLLYGEAGYSVFKLKSTG